MRSFVFTVAALLLGFSAHAKQVDGIELERGVQRPGSDYTDFRAKNATQCAKRCAEQDRCRAFDYDRGDNRCWLKDRVPASRRADNIVSGAKSSFGGSGGSGGGTAAGMHLERDTERPGGDYRNLKLGNVDDCARKCKKEGRCKAFNYNTRENRCFLKDRVPHKQHKRDSISGVKRSSGGGGGGWNGGGGSSESVKTYPDGSQKRGDDYYTSGGYKRNDVNPEDGMLRDVYGNPEY